MNIAARIPIPMKLKKTYARVHMPHARGPEFIESALRELEVTIDCPSEQLDRIPQNGPVIVVANHPFGAIEGLILALLLTRRREDTKMLANKWLSIIPELEPFFFWIDPFDSRDSVRFNAGSVRKAVDHVAKNGLLALFPAGEVSHLRLKERRITDPPWKNFAARLAARSGATIIPVYVAGSNSIPFHLLGLIHPRLRTLMLPHELMNKARQRISVRIGRPIVLDLQSRQEHHDRTTSYLRARTYCLSHHQSFNPAVVRHPTLETAGSSTPAINRDVLNRIESELRNSEGSRRLSGGGDYEVFLTTSRAAPHTISEIGLLREFTFRMAGEGTGHTVDLDQFDKDYLHVILWNNVSGRIAGAYRMGLVDEQVRLRGIEGIYTSTLFRFNRRIPLLKTPSIELGRSFVLPEFQKSFWPLFLLWRGIALYLSENPQYRYLFGVVSISPRYHHRSVQLILSYLKMHHFHPDFHYYVTPRNPYRWRQRFIQDDHSIVEFIRSIDDLSEVIADIEPESADIPVLVRQYLNLGGKIVQFNVDPHFNHTTDALVVVDLAQAPQAVMQKLMGSVSYSRWSTFPSGSEKACRDERGSGVWGARESHIRSGRGIAR